MKVHLFGNFFGMSTSVYLKKQDFCIKRALHIKNSGPKIRTIFCLLVLLLNVSIRNSFPVYGQIDPGSSFYHRSPADNLLLPSPEPAGLLRYVDCPVSYCTGVANFNIPIYSYKGRELNLDISLSYHTTGNKIKNPSGLIEQNWHLQAGGVITRVINGLPDEFRNFELTPFRIMKDYPSGLSLMKELIDLKTDVNFDYYYYDFCGYSGTFIYDPHSKSVTKLTIDDCVVESYFVNSTELNFLIIPPDGIRYLFAEKESVKYECGQGPVIDTAKPNSNSLSRRSNHLLASVTTRVGTDSYQRLFYYLSGMIFSDLGKDAIRKKWDSAPLLEQLIVNVKDTLSCRLCYAGLPSGLRPVRYVLLHNRDTVGYYLCPRYDASGNLQEISSNGLAPVSYLWQTNSLHPDVVVQGIGMDSVLLLRNDRTSTNIRRHSSHIQVTDYTFVPLKGISCIISPSYRKNSFTYTGTRLREICDGYGHKLNDYSYNNYVFGESPGYVRTNTYLDEQSTKYLASTTYSDGLGRPFQTVLEKFCPDNVTNLTNYTEYDVFDRKVREWLPVPLSGTGSLEAGSFASSANSFYKDNHAYSESHYESSPLNRLLSVQGAGDAFTGHPISTTYLTNSSNINSLLACARYKLYNDEKLQLEGYYPAGTLEVVKYTDEDGNISYTFTDFMERVILKRQIGNNNIPHDTYFVYDASGNKRFVLPPLASDELKTKGAIFSIRNNIALKNYAYFYRYDNHNRLMETKKPGAEPCYYLYDKAGQCIFTQNGNQRALGRWSFNIPDAHGRTVITGWCTTTPTINNRIVCARFDRQKASLLNTGYLVSGIILPAKSKLLTVNYYDDYTFLDKYTEHKSNLLYVPSADYGTSFQGYSAGGSAPSGYPYPHIGLRTGTYTAMVDDNDSGFLLAAFYYDERGRQVQQLSTNHLGGYEKEYFAYTFTGKLLKHLHLHSASGKSPLTELYTYSYDSAERLKTITHRLNENPAVTFSTSLYDELGRLKIERNQRSTSLATNYSYNIRNWITKIDGTKFKENLYYNDLQDGTGTRCYNGNISSFSWSAGQDPLVRKYHFTYDGLNRLTDALYCQSDGLTDRYNTSYQYNKMGSILRLTRRGFCAPPGIFKEIDHLTLTYNGNQLKKVDDATSANDPLYSGAFNFVDGSDATVEYAYDKNSNLTRDLNKQLSSIEYNELNLPASVTFSNGKWTKYVYDASGVRRRAKHSSSLIVGPVEPFDPGTTFPGLKSVKALLPEIGGTTPLIKSTITDYCGNVIYKNGQLNMLLTEKGYVTFESSTPVYHYYQKDHLGNNRVVVNQNGEVEEVNHYHTVLPYRSVPLYRVEVYAFTM